MEKILEQFLHIPVSDGSAVLEKFAALPEAVTGCGSKPMERFVYVPGKRQDRILLVAHCDTVWDQCYGRDVMAEPVLQEGLYRSATSRCGIGADDRAGCAMLWALRNSGHSLLVVDGEEKGKRGARYLKKKHKRLYRELNRHRFMLELDWEGTDTCIFRHIPHTDVFRAYITDSLGCTESNATGGCDLQVLCQRICGGNVGVGYQQYHTPKESLSCADWTHILQRLTAFLQQPQPRFSVPVSMRMERFFRRWMKRWTALLRKLKLKK